MDQAPRFEELPDPASPEARRKRRLLGDWRQLDADPGDHTESIFNTEEATQDHGYVQELWNREDAGRAEVELPLDLPATPELGAAVHEHGRSILAQAGEVGLFAQSLRSDVDNLPAPDKAQLAPEAARLDTATEQLHTASEDLEEGLEELDQALIAPSEAPEAGAPIESAVEKPVITTEEKPSAVGMARLVIATLIGGGLGALVGAGEGIKKRKESKEKAKAVKEKQKAQETIKQQEATLAEQKAELAQLKAERQAEGIAPQKEYVKSASELAERQAQLTQETAEQVRDTAQTVEDDRTFHIPERPNVQREQAEPRPDVLNPASAEQLEQLKDNTHEQRDTKTEQPQQTEVRAISGVAQSPSMPAQHSLPTQQPPQPRKQATQTMVYVVLLVAAAAVMLGLLIFGPK